MGNRLLDPQERVMPDEALDIPVNERDAWLDKLTGADAHLIPALRDLLARHAQQLRS